MPANTQPNRIVAGPCGCYMVLNDDGTTEHYACETHLTERLKDSHRVAYWNPAFAIREWEA